MAFSLSFGGVRVTLTPSSSRGSSGGSVDGGGASAPFSVASVRHLPDGRVEARIENFTGVVVVDGEPAPLAPRDDDRADVGAVGDDAAGDDAAWDDAAAVGSLPPRARDGLPGSDPTTDGPRVASRNFFAAAQDERGSAGSGGSSSGESGGGESSVAVVDAVPEENPRFFGAFCSRSDKPHEAASRRPSSGGGECASSFATANSTASTVGESPPDGGEESPGAAPPEPYVPPPPNYKLLEHQLTVEIESDVDDEEEDAHGLAQSLSHDAPNSVSFDLAAKPKVDLSLHDLCASEDADIDDLRRLLRAQPDLASVRDQFGDYPAHVFANNPTFMYASCDEDVKDFLVELYRSHPAAFLTEGYDGQIPFAGILVDWVDACHARYVRESDDDRAWAPGLGDVGGVRLVSEIRSMTKSTRVINSMCVREEVQRLVKLPTDVKVTQRVIYALTMLSHLLDAMGEAAVREIPVRKEFWNTASKRRNGIAERDALIDLSIVRNVMFRPESVDLWLVALLSGGARARSCAADYLRIISSSSLSGLFGRRMAWSPADAGRFHARRAELYEEVRKLNGFLPVMLHLGDELYDVATRRAVKYVVESTIGRPLPVYLMFMECFLLLLLMTTYRIVVELVYQIPIEGFLHQYNCLWGLSLSIAVYFAMRDIAVYVSFGGTEEKLARRYATRFGTVIGYVTTASVITVLSILYVNPNVDGRNFVGIVSGLLWWKFLLHIKGMSENLSTLIYSIMQIAANLKYFLAVFVIGIFFFADMVDIIKKTSGECEYFDGEFTYLAMYAVMIGGFEISSLEGSSALISLLFVAASFCGVIVLVNILIAIVTGEYEKAQQRSCKLFARARLELAAIQVAREKIINPPDDPNSGFGRRLWRFAAMLKYLALMGVVEFFLIKSLLLCTSLWRDGIVGDFLFAALIICAILHHMFLVCANLYLLARAIQKYGMLHNYKDCKFHRALLKVSLAPVCVYMRSVGLGKGESCPDASDFQDDHPLSRNEYFGKQVELEEHIQDALRASEARILNSMKSMLLFSHVSLEE
ncbi:hypothetical protein ACHAWF_018276 [Thalassiosira exigua]